MTKHEDTTQAAGGSPLERGVRPHAWDVRAFDRTQGIVIRADVADEFACKWREMDPKAEAVPLYTQAALETTAEDASRVAREAEAHYWRGMVERLTAQADEWNRRYMALLQQVADSLAMQPAPAILVDLGPNAKVSGAPAPK